ncbi:MAG: hypothetical protein DMG06_28830 [Acidobacteria bacterium]|nr:MAG: hypothetical protein DMG06_28830 [Acidobacteriota bacterium]
MPAWPAPQSMKTLDRAATVRERLRQPAASPSLTVGARIFAFSQKREAKNQLCEQEGGIGERYSGRLSESAGIPCGPRSLTFLNPTLAVIGQGWTEP